MSQITQVDVNSAAGVYGSTQEASRTQEATQETGRIQGNKTRVQGKTIGDPKLSKEAAAYYEKLKKKFSNMDFILVSEDMKEQAQSQAGSYANANKMVVLIDEEKLERMASDESYRKQYEGIIGNAALQMPQMQSGLSSIGANVKGYGIQINDNGTASYFAVIDKSLSAQKERIEKKSKEIRAEKKEEAQEEAQKRLERRQAKDGVSGQAGHKTNASNTVTIKSSSVDGLLQKIQDMMYSGLSDTTQTDWEKMMGQNIDFKM